MMKAEAQLRLEKPLQAQASLSLVLHAHPSSVRPRMALWYVYFLSGKFRMTERIDEELVQYARNHPHDPEMKIFGADLYTPHIFTLILRRKDKDALVAAKRMVEEYPKDPRAYWRLGDAYFATAEYRDALSQYNEALARQPRMSPPLATIAYLLAACPDPALRDGPKALNLATKVWKRRSPDNPRLLMLLAMAHAECGNYQEAVRLARQSLEIVPTFLKENYTKRLRLFESRKPFRFDRESDVPDFLWN